jgi:hypothetical protein
VRQVTNLFSTNTSCTATPYTPVKLTQPMSIGFAEFEGTYNANRIAYYVLRIAYTEIAAKLFNSIFHTPYAIRNTVYALQQPEVAL